MLGGMFPNQACLKGFLLSLIRNAFTLLARAVPPTAAGRFPHLTLANVVLHPTPPYTPGPGSGPMGPRGGGWAAAAVAGGRGGQPPGPMGPDAGPGV